jgi:hypothetical protein
VPDIGPPEYLSLGIVVSLAIVGLAAVLDAAAEWLLHHARAHRRR